jgi:type I restriction enzyme S subunit
MLPQGWVEADIGELCNLVNGKAFKPSEWSKTGLPIIRIQNLNNSQALYNYYDREIPDKFLVNRGDLLFAWSGTPGTSFGAHLWMGQKAILNQHIFKIIFNELDIDKNYFKIAINSTLHELIGKAHGGVGLAHVTKGKFETTKLPLPPLAEQRRIVAKLDSLTARIARARAELERVPVLIARYKKILLKKAFTGELTNKWRLMNGISEIEMTPLSDVCTSITDGDHQAPPRAKYGVPFITISAMNDGKIDLSKATRFVPSSYLDALKDSRKAKTGDVLFSVTGSIGIPALVKHECPFVFQRHIAILKPDTGRVSGLFLKLMLQSPDVQVQCAAVATGTAQLTVPLNRLRNFLIPLPTVAEQIEVIRLVESTCKRLERMQEDYVDADHLLSKLESSLLAKAFRGELVPQDPSDEPANVLLDRIRAERAAAPKPKRGRRQSTQDMSLPRKRQTEKHG